MQSCQPASAVSTGVLPRVALYGTFDVLNFGDLLFPHVIRHGLGAGCHDLAVFSPCGGRLAWADTVAAAPVGDAPAYRADLHVIGGGNIIHAADTNLPDYQNAFGGSRGAYASLWLGAGLIAAQAGARLAWNAPGVPFAVAGRRVGRLRDAVLGASDYVSLRDAASVKFLEPPATVVPVIVPDTALDIARTWAADSLLGAAQAAFTERGVAVPERWLVCHIKSHYADGNAARQADVIRAICAAVQAVPVLLALGPCHGDDKTARAVGAALRRPALVVDRPKGLKEIAGLLAHGAGYAGSSLHGMIASLSYGRPAIAVAHRRMVKFAGFLEHVGMPARLFETWPDAGAAAGSLLQPLDPAALAAIAAAKDRIAAHWERLRALLIGGGTESAVAVRAGLAGWVEMARPGPNDWRAFNLALDPPDDGGAAGTAAMAGPALLRACNICGGKVFAPAGQADQADLGTVCTGCGSPARHRAFRVIADALRIVGRQGGACLLFGRNRIVARGWFLSTVEVAVNATGRIGAASFACAEASADVVVCVDILDRATDYRQALRDLLRATSPGGYVLVGVRLVPGRETTMDWGFPRADRDGTYRMFGRDVVDTIAEALPAASVAVAHPVDPVSGVAVMAIVLAHAPDDLRRLLDSTVPCRLAPYPMVASR